MKRRLQSGFLQRAVSILVSFSFLSSGLAPLAYAEVLLSAPTDVQPSVPDASASNAEVVPVDTAVKSESSAVPDTFTMPIAVANASVSAVDRPMYMQSPAKATNLVVEPNQAFGSLNMRYPLQLPPGRDGLTPEVALVYSSEDHKNNSLVGYGWSLSVPYIYRLNKYGTNHLYQTGKEVFASSIDGELKPIALTDGVHGEYRAELEDGSVRIYVFNVGNSWSMRDKSAALYQFGITQAARLNNPFVSVNGDPVAYTWSLEKMQDINGNSVDYEYDWFVLPKKISYGANINTGQPHIISMELFYEARTDILDQYYTGFKVPSDKRVSDITIKKGTELVRSYHLGYSLGDNKARSMLASLSETVTDADGISKTLQPTTFSYQKSAPGWERNQGLGYASYLIYRMMPQSMSKIPNWAPYYVDVNGDAYPEAFYTQQCGPGSTCSGFKGLAWNTSYRYDNPPISYDQGNTPAELFYRDGGDNWYDYGWQVVDLNGDGIPEMIRSYQQNTNTSLERGTYTFNKNDNRWSPLAGWDMPYPLTLGTADGSTRIFDYNADGLPDMIYATTYGDKKGPAYDNTGTGWSQSHDVVQGNEPDGLFFTESFPQPVLGKEIREDAAFRIGDANGDGLPDGIRLRADGSDYVSINTGTWFKPSGGFNILPKLYFADPKIYCRGLCSASSTDSGTRLFDLNADGIVDIVRSGREYVGEAIADRKEVYIGTGSGWLRAPEWETPSGGIPKLFTESAGNNFITGAVRIVDVNADGMVDIIDIQDTSTSNEGYLNTSKPADYMTATTFSDGGSSTFTYKPSTQYRDAANPDQSSNILNPNLPIVVQTLERVVTSDGMGGSNTMTYEYAGGHYYFANPQDRKFGGFAKVTETDQVRARKTLHYFHQGNGVDTSAGETADSKGRIGREYRADTLNAAGQLLARTFTVWDETALSGTRVFTRTGSKADLMFNPSDSSIHKDKAVSYTYDTATGNLTAETQWGDVLASATMGVFSDIASDKRTTDYTYATGASNLIGLTATKTLRNFSGAKIAENRIYYDDLVLGQATKGNATKSEDWLDAGNRYVATTRTYNTLGLVSSETNPRGAVTQFVYDTNGLYPVQVTNEKNQTTSYTYDPRFGAVVLATDSNGVKSETKYDGLGRTKSKSASSPATGVLTLLETHTYDDASMPRVHMATAYGPSGARVSYEYSNGRGAQVQSRTQVDVLPSEAGTYPSSKFAVSSVVYDGAGRTTKSYVPFASASSVYAATTQPDTQATITTYDALDRPTNVQKSIGGFSKSYGLWAETTTDARGNQLTHTFDAFGNLVRVAEPVGTTQYAYDAAGRLTNITDAEGNIRAISYDSLGRMTRSELAYKTSAPEIPAYAYEYDDAGNKTKETRPDGKSVVWTYDSLNRVAAEDDPATAGAPETAYVYDTAVNGIGKLASITTKDFKRTFVYDKRGTISKDTRTIEAAFSGSTPLPPPAGTDTIVYDDAIAPDWKAEPVYLSAFKTNSTAIPGNGSAILEAGYYRDGVLRLSTTKPVTKADSLRFRFATLDTQAKPSYVQIISYGPDPSGKIVALRSMTLNTVLGNDAVFTPSTWYDVKIPYGSLTVGTYTKVSRLDIKFYYRYGLSIFLDDMRFAAPPVQPANLAIYDDALRNGWKEGVHKYIQSNLSSPVSVSGTAIQFTTTSGNGSLSLTGPSAAFDDLENITFQIRTSTKNISPGRIYLYMYDGPTRIKWVSLAPYVPPSSLELQKYLIPNTWYKVVIPVSSLGVAGYKMSSLYFSESYAGVTLYLDDISLTGKTAGTPPPSSGTYEARTYVTEYAYSDTGHLTSIQYPDATLVSYAYGPTQAVRQVSVNGVKKSEISYAINGKPASIDNGLVTTFTYDPDKQFVLSQRRTSDNSVNTSYTYDAAGNIARIFDAGTAMPKDVTFTYDAVNRLTKSVITAGATTITDFTYSPTGNITNKSDLGAYEYTDARHPHAVTKAGTTIFAYDKNGNLISEGSTTYSYDFANRLSKVTAGANVTTYIYDNTTSRIQKRLANGGRLSYVGNETEVDEAGKFTNYVFAGDDRIITIDPTEGVLYNIEDHLSSASLVVKPGITPTIIQKLDYYPYGTERINEKTTSFSTRHTFTDKELDSESNLQYFGARYYNPTMGRFTSVDPITLTIGNKEAFEASTNLPYKLVLSNPQLQNPYSYTANNPLKYTDANGQFLDTLLDVGFIALDVYLVGRALSHGDSATAKSEGINLGLDTGSAFIPFVAGLGEARRVAQGVGKVVDKVTDTVRITKKLPDSALVVRGTADATFETFQKGIRAHPSGVRGFSAESNVGLDLCALCKNIPNNKVRVSTARDIRAVGGDVISTSGKSPNHVTVTNTNPGSANKVFSPPIKNPVPKRLRNY